MKKIIFLLALVFFSQEGISQETITYKSLWQKKAIDLEAEIYLPNKTKPPFPVIVATHSSSPNIPLKIINGRTDEYANSIKEAALSRGYAVVLMDSFTKRNISIDGHVVDEVGAMVGKGDAARLIADLKKDTRFDSKNFFFTGHSWGGSASYLMAYGNGNHQPIVKAVVASAPGCHIQLESTKIVSPLLIIIGDNDQTVSYKPCLKLEERLRESNKVTVNVIPGMTHNHGSSDSGYNARGSNFTKCADKVILLTDSRKFFLNGKEITQSEMESMCVSFGRPTGNSDGKMTEVINLALNFFDKQKN